MNGTFAQFDPELRKKIIRKRPAAIIPVGSIEQHGAHLPVTADSDIVTHIAGKVGSRIGALVLPAVTYGVSFEHAPFFQISVKKSTLRKQITDICESLGSNGINVVFVINGHHGNQKAVEHIGRAVSGPEVFEFSYWHFMERRFDHAGFVETSLMLAASKNVRMGAAKAGLDESRLDGAELKRMHRLASRSFPEATGNGIWGDPRKATKTEGRRILSEIVENLAKRCQTCMTGQGTKLHQ